MSNRNDPLVFAMRTRKNLEYIEEAAKNGEDVHPVTQLTNSLLGLIVFLHEKKVTQKIDESNLARLWHIDLNLGQRGTVTSHLRNAAAHRRIRFSSDSKILKEVEIEIEDRESAASAPYWRAHINGAELKAFCYGVLDRVEEVYG